VEELIINEIFLSIQGESSFAGMACVMARVTGCPLRCKWCDTAYAYDQGAAMTLTAIRDKVLSYGVKLVEVTGGEPLAQKGTIPLLRLLCDQGLSVLLETSGAEDIGPVDARVRIIMDIKCPSSGMTGRMRWQNLDALKPTDEVKFVLADRGDYEFAKGLIAQQSLARRCQVLFSTVFGRIENKQVVEWLLADRLPVRFQLQMHKYIWPPSARGV
jgi:7-carboxy-7-deazaguanine synthase